MGGTLLHESKLLVQREASRYGGVEMRVLSMKEMGVFLLRLIGGISLLGRLFLGR